MKTIAQRDLSQGEPEEKPVAFQVWLPRSLALRTKGFAGGHGITLRQLFREAVTRYLDQEEKAA